MDEHGPDAPEDSASPACTVTPSLSYTPNVSSSLAQDSQRKYLPTFADLVDRLTIVQLKSIFIPEYAEEYRAEMALILHDIDLILRAHGPLDAESVRAIAVVMLTNHFIWINESKARAGGAEQNDLLRATHSINGVRNAAKNVISAKMGGRKDYKIDALAADLPPEFGNWKIFGV